MLARNEVICTVHSFLRRGAGLLVVFAALTIGVDACTDDEVDGPDAAAPTDAATLDGASLDARAEVDALVDANLDGSSLDVRAEADALVEARDAAKPDASALAACLARLVGADAALVCGGGEIAWCDEACNPSPDAGLSCQLPTGDGLCHHGCGCDSDCTSPAFPKCTTTYFCKRNDLCYPRGLCRAADDDAGGFSFAGACLRDAGSD